MHMYLMLGNELHLSVIVIYNKEYIGACVFDILIIIMIN